MKRYILLLSVFVFSLVHVFSQNEEQIINKGNYIVVNMKCKTIYKTSYSVKSEKELSIIVIKKNAILSIALFKNNVILTTTELIRSSASGSKWYEFEFDDLKSAEEFLEKLTDVLSSN